MKVVSAHAGGAEPKDVGTAMERSSLYGFLAAVFRREPTAVVLRELTKPAVRQAFKAAGVRLGTGLSGRPQEDLLEDLAVEFTQLFVGPGHHVAPYASVHLGGDGAALWNGVTVWVKTFIESAGFEYRPDYHDLPDHISVELEFMQQITTGEARALEESDGEMVMGCRRIESEFVGEHLARWVPAFCKNVAARAGVPFYREMAGLTESFIRSEAEDLASWKS